MPERKDMHEFQLFIENFHILFTSIKVIDEIAEILIQKLYIQFL
jgi:hypothetical protein